LQPQSELELLGQQRRRRGGQELDDDEELGQQLLDEDEGQQLDDEDDGQHLSFLGQHLPPLPPLLSCSATITNTAISMAAMATINQNLPMVIPNIRAGTKQVPCRVPLTLATHPTSTLTPFNQPSTLPPFHLLPPQLGFYR
jgi:hypothetical protein